MIVLTDLEETLIQSWQDPVALPDRAAVVRRFLADWPEARLGLMSWAVHDDADLSTFTRDLQPAVEHLLGRPFDARWRLSLDQWGAELFGCTRKRLPREELFDVFGKADLFLALARHHPEWQDETILLFDDAFDDLMLEVPGRRTQARIVNVVQRAG